MDQREDVARWGEVSRLRFESLATDRDSACTVRTIVRVEDSHGPDAWWSRYIPTLQPMSSEQLPAGYEKGCQFDGVVIDTSLYMPYLMKTLTALGGSIVQRTVTDLGEAQEMFDVVVNCAGLGARELVGDTSLYPTRGQLVRVPKNGLDHVIGDNLGRNALAYIVPRTHDMVLGGTSQPHDDDLRPRDEDTAGILRKCAELSPLLRDVEILEVSVGLRPSRPRVRVEVETRNGRPVVHNYGHGGAGFMLSWGCAADVAERIAQLLG